VAVVATLAALVSTSTIAVAVAAASQDPAPAPAVPVGAVSGGEAATVLASYAGATDAAYGSSLVVLPALAVRRTTGKVAGARYGMDVSWPQCGVTLPDLKLDFAVVGLTHGHAGSVSPCFADQVHWARAQKLDLALYVVPSSPNAATLAKADRLGGCKVAVANCRAFHAGVVQARHALRAARQVEVTSRSWWLDIEESSYGTLWGNDTTANVAVLKGWVSTLRKAHVNVGVYSTGGYWSMITDDWQAGLPQWVAVGLAVIDAARGACDRAFTTGPVVMTQWLTGPYDGNLLCGTGRDRTGFDNKWLRGHTWGVPSLLTIPVPHPEIEALLKKERQAEKAAAAKKAKAAARAKAAAKAKAQAKPKPKPQPKPRPKPRPKPKPPAPTPTPTPTPTPDPSPTPVTVTGSPDPL
jgi:hypothetical protein